MLAELWRRLAPDLGDPDARRVLVDAMLAAGDPQGEYLAHAQEPEPAVLQANARAWLGRYAGVTQRAQFIGGWPARLELNAYHPDEEALAELCAEPRFATVEELVTGFAKAPVYAAIIARGQCASLKRIEIKSMATVLAMATTTAKLAHVAIPVWHDRGTLEEVVPSQILPVLERIPTLTSVGIDEDQRDILFGSSLFPRLASVTLGPDVQTALASWPAMLPHQTLVVAAPRLHGCGHAHPNELRLSHEDGGIVVRVSGANVIDVLPQTIAALPRGVVRIEIDGNIPWGNQTTAVAEQRKIPLVYRPVTTRRQGFVVVDQLTEPARP